MRGTYILNVPHLRIIGLFGIDTAGNISLLGGRTVDREASGVTFDENGYGVISLVLIALDRGFPVQVSQTIVRTNLRTIM